MQVPGAIKRVLKKANLNKQKAVAQDEENWKKGNPITAVDTVNGVKTLTYADGSTSQYEVEQVYTGVLQSTIDAEEAKKKPVSWELLADPEELEPDFKDISEEEFKKLLAAGQVADYTQKDLPETVASIEEANIVTSLVEGKEKTHAAVLDFDFPHTYVPSSTPGHGHLYIDVEWDEETFFLFLETLADFGLIEKGYYQASKRRGYSAVRLPHIKKEITDDKPTY